MSDLINAAAGRYLAGRPLRSDPSGHYPYLRPGSARLAGWQRQALRLVIPGAALAATVFPHAVAVLAVAALWRLRRRWVRRRFHRAYTGPTAAALRPVLGGAPMKLRVDPALGTLVARLAKPLSPAEVALRTWYGRRVEPGVRWAPDRWRRGVWALQRGVGGNRAVKALRRPKPEGHGPRVELMADVPYLTGEQRQLVSAIVKAKIPAGEVVESWDQVGKRVTARWTVRRRPPARVGYDVFRAGVVGLAEWEFFLGLGADGSPVVISLRDDSPHIAVSAGSGAGKSVLAMASAVQVLRRGGKVVILDRKGSHRWALDLPGVDYCSRPEQMHEALVSLAQLADERNSLALHEVDDWDPGQRILVIAEELNATIGMLGAHWAAVRDKSEPKRSPAISGLADLLFMGRSAKINVLAIAQMLSARAIGGPEARENFGIRCLARYTSNAWKMLVPEAAMPRASRTLGRWQVVVGGQATEVQVAYLTSAQARALARPPAPAGGLDSQIGPDVPAAGDTGLLVTLATALDEGLLPWSREATKKRLARHAFSPPRPRAHQGQAALYDREDLAAWVDRSTARTDT